ncbi:hypothetical protein B0H11DRAFT_2367098 [Mycena galericulata]|nr:hypothetical protein B0H11DRAFT_2367098 [Mycena galericulata]
MAPHHLQFISYVPPAPFGTSEGSGSASDPPPKRPRGRPKGSKNKAKDESPTQLVHTTAPGGAQRHPSVPLPTSSTDQLPPAIEIPRQLVRNQADRHEPVELTNMVAHTDIIHSHPSTLRHDVEAQTHSHVHSHRSTVRRDVDVQTTPSVPSVRTPHTSPAPRADVPATAPSTSGGRGVIDRVLVQPNATPAAVSAPTLPPTLDMSDTPPLGFITDVENENDLNSFKAENTDDVYYKLEEQLTAYLNGTGSNGASAPSFARPPAYE